MIKFIALVLVTATLNIFGSQSSPYRCKMSGNTLEADIIVIGAGAAGCVLMSELSENGQFSVLGIEGGLNLTADPAIEAVGLPALLLAGTGKYKYFGRDGVKLCQCQGLMDGQVIGQQEWC